MRQKIYSAHNSHLGAQEGGKPIASTILEAENLLSHVQALKVTS